jgi:hypothetical protein
MVSLAPRFLSWSRLTTPLPDRQGVKPFCVDLCPTVGHNWTQKRHGVDARR